MPRLKSALRIAYKATILKYILVVSITTLTLSLGLLIGLREFKSKEKTATDNPISYATDSATTNVNEKEDVQETINPPVDIDNSYGIVASPGNPVAEFQNAQRNSTSTGIPEVLNISFYQSNDLLYCNWQAKDAFVYHVGIYRTEDEFYNSLVPKADFTSNQFATYISNLHPGNYYCYVIAYNNYNKSPLKVSSSILVGSIPKAAVSNIVLNGPNAWDNLYNLSMNFNFSDLSSSDLRITLSIQNTGDNANKGKYASYVDGWVDYEFIILPIMNEYNSTIEANLRSGELEVSKQFRYRVKILYLPTTTILWDSGYIDKVVE